MTAKHQPTTFAEYLAHPAVSSSVIRSGLAGGLDSMRYAFERSDRDSDDTKALRLGRAAHCRALTPLLYSTTFPVVGKCQGVTKEGHACTYAASVLCDVEGESLFMCGTHAKKYPTLTMTDYVRADELPAVEAMSTKLGRVKELLGTGKAEYTILFDLHGVECKARLDFLKVQHIAELKTCADYPTLDNMQRAVTTHRYHVQAQLQRHAAHQLTGEWRPFVWIFQQSVPPYATAKLTADEETLQAADVDILGMLNGWREAQKSGWFPDPYDSCSFEGGLTSWARKQYEEMTAQITVEGSTA